MPRFRELAERINDRQVRVITAATYESFDAPDIDLSIRFGDGKWPGFTAVHLFDEEGFPICAPELLERHPELLNAPPHVLMKFPAVANGERGDHRTQVGGLAVAIRVPSCRWSRVRYFRRSPFCCWNWWRRAASRSATRTSSISFSWIAASFGCPIESVRSGLGFYACIANPESIPIRTMIDVFRKGIDTAQDRGLARSPVRLDEFARLHDRRQAPSILSEHSNVGERIPVNDQNIGVAPRLNLAELRLHQDLGIHGRCRPQDGGSRLHLAPDGKFSGLMGMQMP